MSLLSQLIESFLTEAVALTKGSQRVMNDKNMVANLADAVRDDARSHPQNFPAGSSRNFQKAPDDEVARWFLENIDRIEREGYDGVVYSRDGVNSDWIVRRYIAGSHNWEDLTGVMNMNLADWYLLKNRNLLEPGHKDLPKFNSVRDVGYYMTTHYKDKIDDVRNAAKKAARIKMAKSVKLVDNEDYRIYTTLNRAAGCALGLGTQWCTANTQYAGHFHTYSGRAMLFQLFPYTDETDETGKRKLSDKEKYQFDAGGGGSFMDITDTPVNPRVISEKYPYIYTDLAGALKANKEKMEQAFAELTQDPTLQGEDYKIKTYEINDEIKKLHKFVDRGIFTDKKRPKPKTNGEPEQVPSQEKGAEHMKPNEIAEDTMLESIADLANEMLGEDKTLGHIVRQFVPTDKVGEESPLTHGDDLEEDDEMVQDAEQGAQAQTGGTLGSAGMGSAAGGQYPPGTAPTMPESINHQGNIMENVDKDVAAMLQSLKKYDILKESVAPVLAKKTVESSTLPAVVGALGAMGPAAALAGHGAGKVADWWEKRKAEKSKKAAAPAAKKEPTKEESTEESKETVKEEADQEVLEWMNRFSKLGNMKGYGR